MELINNIYAKYKLVQLIRHLILYLSGRTEIVEVCKFEIMWNKTDIKKCFPGLKQKIVSKGYKPFTHRSGFIEGFWADGKFMIPTGRHRGQLLIDLKYKQARCLLMKPPMIVKRLSDYSKQNRNTTKSYITLMKLKMVGFHCKYGDREAKKILKEMFNEK